MPYAVPDSLAWDLEPGNDLVLQLHLLPSGKPELVQARVGFFFSFIKISRFFFRPSSGFFVFSF